MLKKTIALAVIAVLALLTLTACSCKHEWAEATCTAPKTCKLCGATEGEPLAHTWDAATCTAPKTCAVCGATEGEPLGHTPGSWAAESADTLGGKEVQKCTVCGEIINTRDAERGEKKEVTVLQPGGLVMNAEEFAQHLLPYLPADCRITNIESDGFDIEGAVDVSVQYHDEEHSYKDNIYFSAGSVSDLAYLLPHLISAVDPAVTGSDLDRAVAMAESNLKARKDGPVLLHTGIGYTHYVGPVVLSSMTIPASYSFSFFTVQMMFS